MKKFTFIYLGLLVIVALVLFFRNVKVTSGLKEGYLQITNSEGPVSVTVTPKVLSAGSDWDFEIALNTHSGSLTTDLVTVSELVDDRGKIYKPLSWKGPVPGGHHLTGNLIFKSVSPKPSSIVLKIYDIGGDAERSFKWNL